MPPKKPDIKDLLRFLKDIPGTSTARVAREQATIAELGLACSWPLAGCGVNYHSGGRRLWFGLGQVYLSYAGRRPPSLALAISLRYFGAYKCFAFYVTYQPNHTIAPHYHEICYASHPSRGLENRRMIATRQPESA
ncbi:hypothetical protein FGRMN_916 [Fusarium graminum]|nr:hypothetical protein FGRMN_916 [Fusarium graminum]